MGVDTGEVDTTSRIYDNKNPLDTTVQLRCNNRLPPSQYWHCQPIEELQTLFKLVDPSILHKHNSDHHSAYMTVSTAVSNLTHVCYTRNTAARILPHAASKLGSHALHRHSATPYKKNKLNGRTPLICGSRSPGHGPLHKVHTAGMGESNRPIPALHNDVARSMHDSPPYIIRSRTRARAANCRVLPISGKEVL